MSVRIVTDSTCDLPAATIAQHGILVAPLYINVGKQGYLDGVDITRQEFYEKLPHFPVQPTTAAPSPNKFRALYDTLADEGATHVISIHIGQALSAVVDVARVAARETKSVAVTVLDGGQLSLGTGFLVETAARLAEAGHQVGEILGALQDQMKRSHVFAALDTLEFLKRSGRMNGVVAGLGSLLKLKPILTMHDGKPGAERVRTHERAIGRVIDMLRQLGPVERVALVHTNAPAYVAELRQKASHLLPAGEIQTEDITPVIGAHIGPGAAGFAVITAKR